MVRTRGIQTQKSRFSLLYDAAHYHQRAGAILFVRDRTSMKTHERYIKKLILLVIVSCVCFSSGCSADRPTVNSAKETAVDESVAEETNDRYVIERSEEEILAEPEDDLEFDYSTVEMHPVQSTVIGEEGYAADHEILLLRFRQNGALYAYYQVSEETYNDFLSADSKGGFFTQNLRDIYKYEMLDSGEGYYMEPLYDEVPKEEATYALNTGTGKFHKLDCRYAEAERIAYVSNTKEELEELEYVPCKVCKP